MTLRLKIKKLTRALYSMYSTTFHTSKKVNILARRLPVSSVAVYTIWRTPVTCQLESKV